MIRPRATLPWLLLAASIALNIHRARRTSSTPAHTSHQSQTSYKPHSDSPAPATPAPPEALTSSVPHKVAASPSLDAQPPTLTSTASRSSAFRGYADLLAEDLKTSEQLASLNDLLARWVATAPTDAATWLAGYDDTPFYDPAARHITLHLVAKQNFPEAATWADLIRDPNLREEARDALIAESYRAKKIDAQAVRLSGLSPAHIESILNGSRLD